MDDNTASAVATARDQSVDEQADELFNAIQKDADVEIVANALSKQLVPYSELTGLITQRRCAETSDRSCRESRGADEDDVPPKKKPRTDADFTPENAGPWNYPGDEGNSDLENRMVRKLNELLKEQVVPLPGKPSTRFQTSSSKEERESKTRSRSASRPKKSMHPETKRRARSAESTAVRTKDLPDSQQSYIPSDDETKFGDMTMKDALEVLAEQTGVEETEHTHKVVNRIVSSVLEELREVFTQFWNPSSPLFKENTELEYFEESNPSEHLSGKSFRRPDSILYMVGRGAASGAGTRLDMEALTIGKLVMFEHKVNITNIQQFKRARIEIERDYADMMTEDLFEQPMGYGVITDGINWLFVRLSTVMEKCGNRKYEAKIATATSPMISIRKEEKQKLGKKKIKYEFDELASWLAFILKERLRNPRKRTGHRRPTATILNGKFEFEFSHLLANNRRLVMRVATKHATPNSTMVLKFRFPLDDDEGEDEAEVGQQLKEVKSALAEFKNLDLFKACPFIANFAPKMEHLKTMLFLEDAGESLGSIITSGDVGKKLAPVVYKDIYCGALGALRAARMCHADIHEGNICVKVVGNGPGANLIAKLVDMESAVAFERELRASPIKVRDDGKNLFFQNADELWDRVSVCAVLECLWNPDLSFEYLRERTKTWKHKMTEKRNPVEVPPFMSEIEAAAAVDDDSAKSHQAG